jgi:hypothetical protein
LLPILSLVSQIRLLGLIIVQDQDQAIGKKNVIDNIYNEITFTRYGWFQPDPQEGLKVGRTFAAKEFMEAVVAHERDNDSAWDDLERNPDPSRPILAF